jgi:hypothetical protein
MAVICGFWIYLGALVADQARYHDFLCLYTGGWMVAHGRMADLYDPAAQLAFQREVIHSTSNLMPYIRPPFHALLIAPLGLLPLDTAFIFWVAGQAALLVGCWIWAWRRFGPHAAVMGALFMPTAAGIAHGQDCILPLALLICSYAAAEHDKPVSAGALLGAALMKFHLILLWPVALLIRRQWKMLSGFVTVAAGLGAVSLMMVGISGLRSYLALLKNRSLENLSPSPEYMISLNGLLTNLDVNSVAVKVLLAGVVIGLWAWKIRGARLPQVYILTSAPGLMFIDHVYGYDASLLLLAIWLTLLPPRSNAQRIAAGFLVTPFAFGLSIMGKPWTIVSSASLLAFFVVSVLESPQSTRAEIRMAHTDSCPASSQ